MDIQPTEDVEPLIRVKQEPGVDPIEPANPGRGGGQPSVRTKEERRQKFEEQMELLIHARKCQKRERRQDIQEGLEQCQDVQCRMMKNVLDHLKTCTAGRNCHVPLCGSSGRIISHWRNCTRSDCPYCIPRKRSAKPDLSAIPTSSRLGRVNQSGMDVSDIHGVRVKKEKLDEIPHSSRTVQSSVFSDLPRPRNYTNGAVEITDFQEVIVKKEKLEESRDSPVKVTVQSTMKISDLPSAVLRKVFSWLNFTTKKKIRLVCKTWNTEICRLCQLSPHRESMVETVFQFDTWAPHADKPFTSLTRDPFALETIAREWERAKSRKDVPTILTSMEVKLIFKPRPEASDLNVFLNKHRDFTSAISHLVVYDRNLLSPSERCREACREVLKKCAGALTQLEMITVHPELFYHLIKGIKFPRLRTFTFPLDVSKQGDKLRQCKLILFELERILRTSPLCALSVKEVGVGGCPPGLLGGTPLRQLKYLEMVKSEGFFLMEMMVHLESPPALKSLIVHHYGEVVINLLRRFSDTLEFVHFQLDRTRALFLEDKFPTLLKLKSLSLKGFNFTLDDMWIGAKAPALTSLRMDHLVLIRVPVERDLRRCPQLRRLICDHISFPHDDDPEGQGVAVVALRLTFANVRVWESSHQEFRDLARSPGNRALPEYASLCVTQCFGDLKQDLRSKHWIK